jgi:hypothetical protein
VRRIIGVAGGVVMMAALGVGTSRAQLTEIMAHNVLNFATDSFSCGTSCTSGGPEQPCNLWNRIYGDKGPSVGINGPNLANACEKDGYPRFGAATTRYNGDGQTTGNYGGINANTDACEAWYSVWDAVVGPGTASFISYYGASSTIINFSEDGNRACANCGICGVGTITAGVCFGALSTASATGTSTNTPLGPTISGLGGIEPVPIVRITASDTGANTLTLAWNAFANETTVNRPSTQATACPGGATFANELIATNGPNPIRALRLFVHTEPEVGAPRTLVSLEGSTLSGTSLNALGNTRDAICFDAVTCPSSHVIPCNGVTGGTCHSNGIDFLPGAQSITVTETAVNSALGADGPVGGAAGKASIVFNTKVVYAGATETASTAGLAALSPKLVSLFSASSAKAAFGGLVSGVQFDDAATVVRGNRITLSWSVVGGSFTEFRLRRAFDGVSFVDIATIPATGQPSYSYTDEIRGRSSSRVFYELVAYEGGLATQHALTDVTLRGGKR